MLAAPTSANCEWLCTIGVGRTWKGRRAVRYYTLTRACAMLGIDKVTLWRWMREAHIKPVRDPGDWRKRRLSAEQFMQLASRHGRLVVKAIEARVVEDLETRINSSKSSPDAVLTLLSR